MSEAKQLPKRQEVPTELTWDLTKILQMTPPLKQNSRPYLMN